MFLALLIFASILSQCLIHYRMHGGFIRVSTSAKLVVGDISTILVGNSSIDEPNKGLAPDSIMLSSESTNHREPMADFIRRWCDCSEGNQRPTLYIQPSPGRLGKFF